jgi:hypothetical protein
MISVGINVRKVPKADIAIQERRPHKSVQRWCE